MNKHFLTLLLPVVACGGLRAGADTFLVDAAQVPHLKPQARATADKDGTLPPAMQRRLEPEKPVVEIPASSDGKDHNIYYRKHQPYPQIVSISTFPFIPFEPERMGVERVEAYDISYLEGVTAKEETRQRQVRWQWQAPVELKHSWNDWSTPHEGTKRYAALSLTPLHWTDRNPTLCYFDAAAGLKWSVEVPLDATMQEAASDLPQPTLMAEPKGSGNRTMPMLASVEMVLALLPCIRAWISRLSQSSFTTTRSVQP